MDRGSETRSGLLWEVERILLECKEDNCLPDVLLMENVPQVHGTENTRNWREWLTELERLGYQSYWEDMIATDYGIPQIRNRTFCVSLLGEYSYNFPRPIKLTKRLKDLLENKVDDKYYLSDTLLKNFIANEQKQAEKGDGFKFDVVDTETETDRPAKTITTKSGGRMDDNFVYGTDVEHYETKAPHGYFPGSIKKADAISTIDACVNYQHIVLGEKLKINNATKQGYLEAEEGDGIDITTRPKNHRGTVQKGAIQTLSTMSDKGVVVKVGNYYPSQHSASTVVSPEGVAPIVMENHGQVSAIVEKDDAPTVQENHGNITAVVESRIERHYKNFIDKHGYIPETFDCYNETDTGDKCKTLGTASFPDAARGVPLIKEEND